LLRTPQKEKHMIKFFTFFAFLYVVNFAQPAAAGSINADLRIDYDSISYNSKTVDATYPTGSSVLNDSAGIKIQTGRVDFKGQTGDDISYRLRLRFDKDKSQNINKRDGVDSSVDYAYITHKATSIWNISAGKIASQIGGIEGNTPGSNLYTTSVAFQGTTALGGSRTTGSKNYGILGARSLLYYTGIENQIKFGNHSFALQFANQEGATGVGYGTTPATGTAGYDDNSGPSATYAQNKLLTGMIYRSQLLDKSLNLIVSYHTLNFASEANKASLFAAGIESVLTSALTLQYDYINNQYQTDMTSSKPQQYLISNVVSGKYSFEHFAVIAKVALTKESLEAGTKTEITKNLTNDYLDYGVAGEFSPEKNKNFKYFAAYNRREMNPDAQQLTRDMMRFSDQFIIGTKINADFLKD
jgi:hypothetical protein